MPDAPTAKPVARWLQSLLLAAAYVVLARAGQALAIPPGNVTSVWIPSGFVLAVLLLRGRQLWPGVFLGALLGNIWAYFASDSVVQVASAVVAGVANGVGDTLGLFLGATLILRVSATRTVYSRLPGMWMFLAAGAGLSSAISALFGVTSLAIVGILPWHDYGYTFGTWFLGDAVGVLLVAPVILVWVRPATGRRFLDVEALAFVAFMILVAAHCLGLLPLGLPVTLPLFTLTPLFMWGVFRLDARVTFPTILLVAAMSVVATLLGSGPFSAADLSDALLALQLFLATISVTVLVFHTLSEERAASQAALGQLNAALERRVDEGTRELRSELLARRAAEEAQVHLERQILHGQKLESLGVLAGGVAHDYNNMLTVILANAELALLRMGGQDPARPLVVAVIGAAQRSAALTRQMLTYSGRGSFQMMDVDLGEHVVAMREILRVAAGRGTEPTFRVTGDRLHVHADPAQLDQLLMNLVINAAEAMGPDEGEIVVEVSSDKLERGYFEGALAGADLGAGRYVRLRVRDTGSGMDPATRQRIFEPFFSSKATGRGLGMAVVHGIVRGHQCAVKVDTALGVGTTFEVLFPAREG